MGTQRSKLELNQYLPDGWGVMPSSNSIQLIAPDQTEARSFHEGMKGYLVESARDIGKTIQLVWSGCSNPIEINYSQSEESDRVIESSSQISSWGSETIRPSAEYEAVLDFVKGQKLDGNIVTITSMVDDKCLMVNDLQALDRGGGWTAQNWIGIDFKKLWIDSFTLGRHNYYGELRDRIVADQRLREFEYEIRRPSGALARYSSNYHYIENFLGGAVRIAVSRPGDWSIVEAAPNGSVD